MSKIRRFVVCVGIATMVGAGGLSLTGCADSFTAPETASVAEDGTKGSNKVIERYFRLPPSGPIGPGENTTNSTTSDSTSTGDKDGKG